MGLRGAAWHNGSHTCLQTQLLQVQIQALLKIVYVAEANQWRCLEESGHWLENVDRAHLVLASGKLVVLQKIKSLKARILFENISYQLGELWNRKGEKSIY